MFVQDIAGILPGQKIKIKYDCDGEFERCGEEWELKLKDAQKNFEKNGGKHICRQCTLKSKNPMHDQKAVQKIKETNLERYGVECSMNTPELIAARQEQFKDKDFIKQRNEKTRKTSQEKYGTDHPMQSGGVQDTQRRAMQERYGVDHPYQSEDIMEKMRANNLEKYGVENVSQIPEIQKKMMDTRVERYGVEHYNQLPEMREYFRENCRDWLADAWANPWAKGITRPEEWNQKQRETVAELIAKGEWHTGDKNSIKGRYASKKCIRFNPMFRSSYELIVHIWCDNNDNIESYDYEPFMLPYQDTEGKQRHYFIDFSIKFVDSDIIFLLEVKNDYSMKAEINRNKDAAARAFATKSDYDYELWSNKKIKSLDIDITDYADRYICFDGNLK